MHEVLGEGQTQGRVSLAEVGLRPGAIGVGALEGLSGEITIVDGHAWIAKETSDSVESFDQRAALLAVAHVPLWEDHPLEAAIAASEFDSTIRETARAAGLDVDHPFPFIIEGRLTVAAHVVHGGCPHSGGSAGADQPERFRFETRDESGLLVGFYADNTQGSLTHHGSRTHVHILIPGNKPQSGHVDSAEVAPCSVLRLPLSRFHVGL
jgi:acetolactate decarboxylase